MPEQPCSRGKGLVARLSHSSTKISYVCGFSTRLYRQPFIKHVRGEHVGRQNPTAIGSIEFLTGISKLFRT